MVEHDEPWQVYADNGIPLEGQSASKDEFANNQALVMAAAHVWIWRRAAGGVEMLLQKRSTSKRTWPGLRDISAAGHTDAGESPLESAVREAKEEIGITIDPNDLYFVFSFRTPLDTREIDHIYLYELKEDVDFHFDDGEVESLEWVSLNDFKKITERPDDYDLVPQGNDYFSILLGGIIRISDENHRA